MTFADEAARAAGTGYTITADDVGKTALQTDDNSYWVLMGVSPLVWDVQGPAVATVSCRGLMSAADKAALDSFSAGNVYQSVRNETGSEIPAYTLLYASGWSAGNDRPLVGIADKDTASKRPAIGVLTEPLANNANGDALKVGTLYGTISEPLDTSAWLLSDQLVLGGSGQTPSTEGEFMRPPPGVTDFTGEIQWCGSVTKVDVTAGHIAVNLGGMAIITADQVFALAGTDGTPSNINKYVTDSDSRMTDARMPTAHAASHQNGGSDEVATATPAANAIPKAGAGGDLDGGWIAYGTLASTACEGNDSRLSDARTPTAHAASHTNGSDDIQSATSTQKGLATATQISKLDGIESGADVTDATNVVESLDGATLTAVTVAATDKVLIQDVSDANNLKTVTAQSIADLGGGGGGNMLYQYGRSRDGEWVGASSEYGFYAAGLGEPSGLQSRGAAIVAAGDITIVAHNAYDYVNNAGHPSIQYRINGGTWTSIGTLTGKSTLFTGLSISVAAGDYLEMRYLGAASGSATISHGALTVVIA